MANKEERIEVCTYDLNNINRNGDIPIDIIKVYTRQEAIEVMAKEIYKRRWIESECKDKNTLGFLICKDYAEIALNALLEGVIKKKNNTVYELYTYNNGEKVTIGYSENMTDEKELEIKYK